jgi:SET domain-containing protein
MIIVEEDNAPDTYVNESSIEGYGLFASKDFKKEDLIIDYNLFPESWYELDYNDLSEDKIKRSRFVMINNNRCITSDKISKFGYINHSRNSNCKCIFEKRLVIADRDIKKDEELFIDYRLEPRPNHVKFPDWI